MPMFILQPWPPAVPAAFVGHFGPRPVCALDALPYAAHFASVAAGGDPAGAAAAQAAPSPHLITPRDLCSVPHSYCLRMCFLSHYLYNPRSFSWLIGSFPPCFSCFGGIGSLFA